MLIQKTPILAVNQSSFLDLYIKKKNFQPDVIIMKFRLKKSDVSCYLFTESEDEGVTLNYRKIANEKER